MFVKTNIFRALALKNSNGPPLSYWLLVCLRFILTVLPQTGYIHPDEYFQNVEVIAGDVFSIDVSRTWEFNPKFPIRNIFIPKVVFMPPLQLMRLLNAYLKYSLDVDLCSPYFLLVVPRVVICLLSLVNDYCLYRICIIYGQNFKNRLQVFASSYIILIYACRGFSNTFEMLFFSVLLLLVAECMSKSDTLIYHEEFLFEKYKKATTVVEKVKLFKLKSHLPGHSYSHVSVIATVTVIGIFNRPTFVGFAMAPVFFWLHRGLGSKVVGFKDFHLRMLALVLCAVPVVALLVLMDSVYYGYLSLADVESLKISWANWVLTPLNFVRYNWDQQNLERHGLHPHWVHLVINVPLLFNVLAGLAFVQLSINFYRFMRGQYSKLPRIQSITGLMLFSLALPLGLLSLFPHQEARFIVPALLPLVYLHGNGLHGHDGDGPRVRRLKRLLLASWYILNALLAAFFGFAHQGGVYPFVRRLHRELSSASTRGAHCHVLTTHTYSVPTYLLQLPNTRVLRRGASGQRYRLAPHTFIYKYGSLPVARLLRKVDEVLTDAEMLLHEYDKPYRFYVAMPCALEARVAAAARAFPYFRLVEEHRFYPHFCSEALPDFPRPHDPACAREPEPDAAAAPALAARNHSLNIDLNIFQRISCFIRRFCFKVYSVKALHNKDK